MCKRRITVACLGVALSWAAGTATGKLVAYYPLDEGTGTTAQDASGNNHNATLQGTPTWVAGQPGFGQALYYSGNNPAAGWVNCGTWNPSAATGQLTVAFWAKWGGPNGNWTGVVGKRNDWDATGANSMWFIEISATNNQIAFGRGGSNPNCGGRVLPVQEWTHVAAAYDGTTLVFYIGGVETGRGAFSFGPTLDAALTIGCDNASGWNSFFGSLDDVRFYDTALSAAEVKALAAPVGASKPSPADGSNYGQTYANLSWAAGATAISHDVYFGTNRDDVANGAATTFLGNQIPAILLVGFPGAPYPQGLTLGQTYYWRVDEVDATGARIKGDVWSFLLPSKKAFQPTPADGATFVDVDADFAWSAGQGTVFHTVYFGGTLADANKPAGGALTTQTTFDPGPLQNDRTYYWRVDEFDGKTMNKGDIWTFTVTSGGLGTATRQVYNDIQGGLAAFKTSTKYPDNPDTTDTVTALESTSYGDARDNYGGRLQAWVYVPVAGDYTFWIAADDEAELWLSTDDDPSNAKLIASATGWTGAHEWTKYPEQKSQPIKLDASRYYIMALWKDYTSGDGVSVSWQGPGVPAQAVIGGRYLKPFELLAAYGAKPLNKAVDVPQTGTMLVWKPGTKAGQHDVYFGDNAQAVADATAATAGVYQGRQVQDQTTFDPGELEWGKTYYWRIDEVNEGVAGSPWKGSVWSFAAADFLIIDDMESYTDEDGSRIYQAWIDGLGPDDKTPGNGSGALVGYPQGPFAEQTIVHSGRQSMPLDYNNAKLPFYSETVTSWSTPQNWTVNGVSNLTVWFRGNPRAYLDKGNGAFTVSGAGSDIWNDSDNFRFVCKRLTGDGSIVVKVESIVNTNGWAKAGVMIRETLDPTSRFAYLVSTPSQGVSFGWRTVAGGGCNSATQTGLPTAQWIKLIRTGNIFTAQYSAEGKTWSDIKDATTGAKVSTTIAMGGSLYIGLCVTSHNVATTTTAEFTGAATTGGVSGVWQMAPIGSDPELANDPDTLYVAIEDSTGKVAVVSHPDPTVVTTTTWTQWQVPLSSFTGVSVSKVRRFYIGVGDRKKPTADGAGRLYLDDVRVTK